MFVGHYSVAFAVAARPEAPKLGTLFVAAQLIDFGFFGLTLTGAETMRITPGISAMNAMDLYDMPWTHSLLGASVWALGFGIIIGLVLRSRAAGALAGVVVLSHWLLDLLVHIPDLTLAGGPPKLGLGLWNHPALEMPIEIGLLAIGVWFYARRTVGMAWPLALLVALLLGLQLFNWFGPPPAEADASQSILALFVYSALAVLAWQVARGRSHIARHRV